MLWLIAPVFIVVSVCMCIWPSKVDKERPGYKRRDWPVILGLFGGGVAAGCLWAVLMSRLPQGRIMRILQFGANQYEGNGRSHLVYGSLCAILVYCAVDEALLKPDAEAKTGHVYPVRRDDVIWLSVLAIIVFLDRLESLPYACR